MKKLYLLLIIIISGLLLLSGCSNQMEAEAEPVSEVSSFHVIVLSENTMTAYVHGDHWHGSIPVMKPGESLSLGAYIEDESGNEIKVDGVAYFLSAAFAGSTPENIISFEPHNDHIDFTAEQEGVVSLLFHLLHEGELIYETPPILFAVEAEQTLDEQDEQIAAEYNETIAIFQLINRRDNTVAPDVDGDHWHGRLPVIKTGESLSLGAYIENDENVEIELDGVHFLLSAAVADGANTEIVTFDFHGDHLYLVGMQAGETKIVFHFVHDGNIYYETPPLNVKVD
jgi:hypothetical protein